MNELALRTKSAARLPPEIARPITMALYIVMSATDRIYLLKGAVDTFRPTVEALANQEEITRVHAARLRAGHDLLATHLTTVAGKQAN